MYYDEDQMLRVAGPAAVSEKVVDEAEIEGWFKAELCVRLSSH